MGWLRPERALRRQSSMRRSVSLCSTLIPAVLAVQACSSSDGASSRPVEMPIPAVEVVQAREGTVPLRERLTGTVKAAGEIVIYPQVNGSITEVLAQNGDRVSRGQPLVRIQAPGGRAQVRSAQSAVTAAEAELRQAQARAREIEAEYERNRALGERGLVPRNTVDSLRSQAEAARAAVNSAAAQVKVAQAEASEQRELQSQTVVRAPINGRVGARNAEVGMRVDAQTPLFTIGRLDEMRVEVPVAQEIVSRLRPGQRAELRVGETGQPIAATVSRISPFLDPGSFSAEVEIDVPDGETSLISGMFVTVDVYYGEGAPTTLVPASALYEDPAGGERGVFVAATPPVQPPPDNLQDVEPSAIQFRPVRVGAEAGQTVGVEGVRPGEWVVVVGQHLLAEQTSEGVAQGRARPLSWEQVLALQQLQREDLLNEFLDRQRRSGGPQ
jgi:HlyD family secretion protein